MPCSVLLRGCLNAGQGWHFLQCFIEVEHSDKLLLVFRQGLRVSVRQVCLRCQHNHKWVSMLIPPVHCAGIWAKVCSMIAHHNHKRWLQQDKFQMRQKILIRSRNPVLCGLMRPIDMCNAERRPRVVLLALLSIREHQTMNHELAKAASSRVFCVRPVHPSFTNSAA